MGEIEEPEIELPVYYFDKDFKPVDDRKDAVWQDRMVTSEDGTISVETLRINIDLSE